MGEIKEPEPVKLVMPMFAQDTPLLDRAAHQLETVFGPIDYVSSVLPFAYTRYYEREFGTDLKRQFFSFAHLIDRHQLADIKLLTNELEFELGMQGSRGLNIDPGYMSPAKFVLATTKNNAHRIYIGKGIFAEITLSYQAGHFQKLPWTYRDYATNEYAQILAQIRALYMNQRHSN